MSRIFSILSFLILAAGLCSAAPKTLGKALCSPDGKLQVSVDYSSGIVYSLCYDGTPVLCGSAVSMTLDGGVVYGSEKDKPSKVISRSVNKTINAVFYKKTVVEDKYNELELKYREFSVIFRAYDEGLAYRFVSCSKKAFKVVSEQADFACPSNAWGFIPYVAQHTETLESQFWNSFENTYVHCPLSEWDSSRLAFLPVMIDLDNGVKACIMESDLLDYPGMYLHAENAATTLSGVFAPVPKGVHQGGHNNLQMIVDTREDYIAESDGPRAFQWRIVSVSGNDADMLDNDMVYRLASAPAEGSDFSWVKPGKVAWEWWNNWNVQGEDFVGGVNNATYRYFIDFATENSIEYVILDEGWAVNGKADLFAVVPAIDIRGLVDYASSKGVGIILWAGYQAFARDMEKVCAHYSEMGVKGFKVDFMDRDDRDMVAFHRDAAEMCAKYHMMIDFHGTYKPAGLNRTYPNVVNYEGVHGLEQCKWGRYDVLDQVTYDVTFPFIRMAAGPVDYTQGAMKNAIRSNFRGIYREPMSQGTRCRQLALYVVLESPLNMLCDAPSNYKAEQECTDFIASVPTVWDETRALDGEVGRYIVIARRKGDEWYIGALTNWDSTRPAIDLSFLPEGPYDVEIFRDGANASRFATDYKHETVPLPEDRKLKIRMASGGGWAARLKPLQ